VLRKSLTEGINAVRCKNTEDESYCIRPISSTLPTLPPHQALAASSTYESASVLTVLVLLLLFVFILYLLVLLYLVEAMSFYDAEGDSYFLTDFSGTVCMRCGDHPRTSNHRRQIATRLSDYREVVVIQLFLAGIMLASGI